MRRDDARFLSGYCADCSHAGMKAAGMKQHPIEEETAASESPSQEIRPTCLAFGSALAEGDIDKAVGFFQEDCYWRDLCELHLEHQDHGRPRLHPRHAEEPDQEDQAVELGIGGERDSRQRSGRLDGWLDHLRDYRRYGHIRAKGNKIWTLLTTLVELMAEERRPALHGRSAPSNGSAKNRPSWARSGEKETAISRPSPKSSSSAAARAASRSARG